MELLVVISIIALLLSILLPSLSKIRSMAECLKCKSNLRQTAMAMDFYLKANNNTFPCAQDPVSASPYYWLWMGRGWRDFVEPYLVTGIDANNPSVLVCPADKTRAQEYERTSYAYSMTFYHSPQQINDMNSVTDNYLDPVTSIPQKSCRVSRPCAKILIGEWDSNHSAVKGEDPGWWGWKGTRNFIFVDSHVQFLDSEEISAARDGWPNPNLTVDGIKGMDYMP